MKEKGIFQAFSSRPGQSVDAAQQNSSRNNFSKHPLSAFNTKKLNSRFLEDEINKLFEGSHEIFGMPPA